MLSYKYSLVFISITLGGDFALVPLVYSTHLGFFTWYELLSLIIISELISDIWWYAIGRTVGEGRLYALPFIRHKPHVIEKTSNYIKSKDVQILFMSKFIYGTRVVTQVLCAVHKMRFDLYLFVNIFGYVLWTLILMGIVSVVGISLGSLQNTALRIQLSFAIIVILVILFLVVMKKLSQRWRLVEK